MGFVRILTSSTLLGIHFWWIVGLSLLDILLSKNSFHVSFPKEPLSAPSSFPSNRPSNQLHLQTTNCIYVCFTRIRRHDWYETEWDASGTNYQIIISSLRSARAALSDAGPRAPVAMALTARAAGRGLLLPTAVPGNWDQMLLWVQPGLWSNLEAFILWRRCLVKPCSPL